MGLTPNINHLKNKISYKQNTITIHFLLVIRRQKLNFFFFEPCSNKLWSELSMNVLHCVCVSTKAKVLHSDFLHFVTCTTCKAHKFDNVLE